MLRLSRHNQKFVPYLWLGNKPQKQNYHLAKDSSDKWPFLWKPWDSTLLEKHHLSISRQHRRKFTTREISMLIHWWNTTNSDPVRSNPATLLQWPRISSLLCDQYIKSRRKKKKKRSEISIPAENSFRLKLSTAENSWHLSVLPLQPVYK